MAGTYLGTVSVGEAAEGLFSAYGALRDALSALRGASVAANAAMAAGAACFSAQLSLLGAAGADISAAVVPSASASVSGSADAVASLAGSLLDPVGYFEGLLAGLVQVQASITADLALPLPSLQAQLAAAAAVSADLDLGLGAVNASLAALAAIELGGSECALALLAASAAFAVAISAAQSADAAAQGVIALGDVPGAHALVLTGPLSALGSYLDAATPSSGVPGATAVRAVVSFVLQSDGDAMSAQSALLKVS